MPCEILELATQTGNADWTRTGGTDDVDAVAYGGTHDDSSYLESLSSGEKHRFTVANSTGIKANDEVVAVWVNYRAQHLDKTAVVRFNIFVGIDSASSSASLTPTPWGDRIEHSSHKFTEQPAGGAWTKAAVDALEVEIEHGDADDMQVSSIWVVVEWRARVTLETGDFSELDDTTQKDAGANSTTIESATPIVEAKSLSLEVVDATAFYSVRDTGWLGPDVQADPRYLRWRVYISPDGLTMAANDLGQFIDLRDSSGNLRGSLRLHMTAGGSYAVSALVFDDGSTPMTTASYTISGTSAIEVEIARATSSSAADGHLKLWHGDVLKETVSGIDLWDLSRPTKMRLGYSGKDAGTSGEILLDALEIRTRSETIGGLDTPVEASTVGRYEALELLDSSRLARYEAVEGVSAVEASRLARFEALEGVESSLAATYEAIERLEVSQSARYGVLALLEASKLARYEAVSGLEASTTSRYEALSFLVASTLARYEALELLDVPALARYEALALLEASTQLRYELIELLESSTIGRFEAVSGIDSVVAAAYEAIELLESSTIGRFEAVSGIDSETLFRFAALAGIEADAATTYEALALLESSTLARYEALGEIASAVEASTLARYEALESIDSETSPRFVSLAGVEADAAATYESLELLEVSTLSRYEILEILEALASSHYAFLAGIEASTAARRGFAAAAAVKTRIDFVVPMRVQILSVAPRKARVDQVVPQKVQVTSVAPRTIRVDQVVPKTVEL